MRLRTRILPHAAITAALVLAAAAIVTPAGATGAAPKHPTITLQPTYVTFTGAPAVFHAGASGRPAPHLQWYKEAAGSWSAVPGATNATYALPDPQAAQGDLFRMRASNRYGAVVTRSVAVVISIAPPPDPVTSGTTGSWAGYVKTGASFTAASATWVVPTVTCTPSPTLAVQWVGIDGYGEPTVEQVGTETDCVAGSGVYKAWYEMWGDPLVNSGLQIDVAKPLDPGDLVTASVSYASSVWTFSIADATQGWSFSIPESDTTPPTARATAEFIEEEPYACDPHCVLTQLAQVTPLLFSNISVTENGLTSALTQDLIALTMTPANAPVQVAPGPLSSGGTSFSDTWLSLPSPSG